MFFKIEIVHMYFLVLALELVHIAFKFSRNILLSDVEFLKRFVLSVKPKYILTLLLIVDLDDLYFWVIHLEQKKTFFI